MSSAGRLVVEGLTVTDHKGAQPRMLVEDVSLELAKGEALGIVGESGSGKSLTLRALVGHLPHGLRVTAGNVFFDGAGIVSGGQRVRPYRHDVFGMVFQDPASALDPIMRVGEQIAEVYRLSHAVSAPAAKKAVIELIARVGIDDPERRYGSYPHEISGGQRQRMVIAIALAKAAPLVLCDEPTTALDTVVQAEILALLSDLRQTNQWGTILVSHDLAVVGSFCSRIAVMRAGRIVEQGPTARILGRPEHPYTIELLTASRTLERQRARVAHA